MEDISIFGVNINNTTKEDVENNFSNIFEGNKTYTIYTPNTEIVMSAKKDLSLRNILNEGDYVLPDGIGLIYASKIRKKPLLGRVTGFDISIELLKYANENSKSMFIIGGKPNVAEIAAENIQKTYPNIKVLGVNNGYFKGSHLGITNSPEEEEIIKKINDLKPDFIFVSMGFPYQELFINANKNKLETHLMIGNGGVTDILAGKAKRAPEIWQKLGLEWFYRLIKEPTRIKRQIAIPKFLISILLNSNSVEYVNNFKEEK